MANKYLDIEGLKTLLIKIKERDTKISSMCIEHTDESIDDLITQIEEGTLEAKQATNATNDGDGSVISTTYVKKTQLADNKNYGIVKGNDKVVINQGQIESINISITLDDGTIEKYELNDFGKEVNDAFTALSSHLEEETSNRSAEDSQIKKELVSLQETSEGEFKEVNSKINENATSINNLQSDLKETTSIAKTAKQIAEGRSKAIVFNSESAMKQTLLNASANDFQVGDNLLIKEQEVPDYWISAAYSSLIGEYGYYDISILETQKTDLSDYYTINETNEQIKKMSYNLKATFDASTNTLTLFYANSLDRTYFDLKSNGVLDVWTSK